MFGSRSLGRFISGTLLSRVTGLGRDIAMAVVFGSHPAVAAFLVAFRFSHLLRRLFGERALQSTFLPRYESLRSSGQQPSAFAVETFFAMTALLLGIIGAGELLLWWWQPADWNLLAWVLPSLLFICLYALNSACLQSHHSFFLFSVAPALCNGVWIAAIFLLRNQEVHTAMEGLAIAVTIGCALQWLGTLPSVLKHLNVREWLIEKRFFPSSFQKMSYATLATLIGVGAMQVNAFLDTLFAEWADPSGPVYLWYAIRLQQLPLALLGIGSASVLAPLLTRALQQKEKLHFLQHLSEGGRHLNLLWGVTAAIFAFGALSIAVIYGHGQFSSFAVMHTAQVLWAYGIGLVPAALVLFFSTLFYAQEQFFLPMKCSLITVGINILLNTLFVWGFSWGATSIALATTASAWINSILLYRAWQQRHPDWRIPFFFLLPWKKLGKILSVSSAAWGAVAILEWCLGYRGNLSLLFAVEEHFSYAFWWQKGLLLMGEIGLFGGVFLVGLRWVKVSWRSPVLNPALATEKEQHYP